LSCVGMSVDLAAVHGGSELWPDDSCFMPRTTAVHRSVSVTSKYPGQQRRQTRPSVITCRSHQPQSCCSVGPMCGIFIVVAVRRRTRLFTQVVGMAGHALLWLRDVSGTKRDVQIGNSPTVSLANITTVNVAHCVQCSFVCSLHIAPFNCELKLRRYMLGHKNGTYFSAGLKVTINL